MGQSTKGRSGPIGVGRDEAGRLSPVAKCAKNCVRGSTSGGCDARMRKPCLVVYGEAQGELHASGGSRYQDAKAGEGSAGYTRIRMNQLSRHCFRTSRRIGRMSDISEQVCARRCVSALPGSVVRRSSRWRRMVVARSRICGIYDGAQVESVLMRYPQRTTLCVWRRRRGAVWCRCDDPDGPDRNLSWRDVRPFPLTRRPRAEQRAGRWPRRPLSSIVFMDEEPLALQDGHRWCILIDRL